MADYDLQPTDLDPFSGGGIDPSALGQFASDAWDWLKGAPGRFTQAQAADAQAQEAWRKQSGSTDPLGLTAPDGSLSPRAQQGIGIMGGLAGNGVLELPNAMQDAAMATRLAGAGDRVAREALPIDSTPAPAQAAAPTLEPVDHDPFIVYHGSRHTFEEAPDNPFGAFQDTAIGSGEGAQVYGVGHYVAQNPKIAEWYRTAGAPSDPISRVTLDNEPFDIDQMWNMAQTDADGVQGKALLAYHRNDGDVSGAITGQRRIAAQEAEASSADSPISQLHNSVADWLEQNSHRLGMSEVEPDPGNLYKVQFTANPDHLLDWDAPFSQQHPEVQAKLQAAGLHPQEAKPEIDDDWVDLRGNGGPSPTLDWSGESIYKRAGAQAWDASGSNAWPSRTLTDPMASQALSDAGIPGIKYYDAGSRSNNVFNQSLIKNYQKNIADYQQDLEGLQARHQNQIDNPDPSEDPHMQTSRQISIQSVQDHISHLQDQISQLSQDDRTRNLVVFNPKHLNIVSRNGEALDLAPVDHDPFNPEDPFYTQGAPQP